MTDRKTNGSPSPYKIEVLLPWHAAGTLNSYDADAVATALAQDRELARRFAMVREEMTETIHLNETLGAPSARAMENLAKVIDKEPKGVRSQATSSLAAWLADLFTPRVQVFSASAAALIVVLQAAVIAKMVLADRGVSGATFETAFVPSRPITMIVPSAAGDSIGKIGRIVAQRMRQSLGQPVITENVSGADGSIGVDRVARAKPDGYTIGLGFTGSHVLNAALYSLPYDVMNDFATISPIATTPLVFYARKSMPGKDLTELIDWLKANPNKASMGVVAASSMQILSAFFQKETGTQFALVPYGGIAPAMQDLVAGQIDLLIGSPDQLPLMRAGSIKAYTVTSRMRSMVAPDIPTFSEMGLPALSFTGWYGLFAPKSTPRDTVRKINAAAVDAMADQAVQSWLFDLGYDVFPRELQTPEALSMLVQADAAKWGPIIKELGVKAR